MVEPIPFRIPDEFLTVQLIAVGYVLLTLGITAGLVALWIPLRQSGLAFVAVGAVLSIPFWPLFRRYYPRHNDG